MKPSLTKVGWVCGVYAAVHLAAHLSARWFEVTPGISIWYVPGGLALALTVLLGARALPVVFAANLATAWFPMPPVEAWMVWFFPLLITVVYGGAGLLVRRYAGGRLLPGETRETVVFCLAAVTAPLVTAVAGTAAYAVLAGPGEAMAAGAFWPSVMDWWIGDASGVLTVVPVIMVFVAPWLRGEAPAIDVRRLGAKRLAMGAMRTLVLTGSIVLVLAVPGLREHDAFYICFLPLIWICVHHGVPGAVLATLLVMMTGLVSMRMAGTTAVFSHIFLLFELAVSSVGLGLGTMVSRRNEAERRLAASQAQLDRVIAGAQLGLWEWDTGTGAVDFNERFAGMIGYRAEEAGVSQEYWRGLMHPGDAARVGAALQAHIEGRSELYEAEYRLRTKEGHWRWLQARGSIVARRGGAEPARVSGTQVDITDRKRAEAEAERLSRVIEATPDFILMADAQGRVIYANAAVLGVSRHAGECLRRRESLRELIPGEVGRQLMEEALPAALAGGIWHGEGTFVCEEGREITASQVVLAHRDEENDTFLFSVIMRDISDQKRAEAERRQRDRELLQLQKAESLGVLAGGIAHDFNNLLTAVVGNANLARFEFAEGSEGAVYITRIEEAATRAAALCQQMLAYAGRNPVAFAEIEMNRLAEDACRLLEPSIGKKITVVLEPAAGPAPVLAAGTQMQQVVMNLVLNAAEAIGEREGRVTVRTGVRVLDEAGLRREFPGAKAEAGVFVVLEVADTGCGMSAETQARIFEPFFTTKFTGQGLGLAAVSGVVKAHRGAIAVASAPGEGSVFRVALPALVSATKPAAAARAPAAVPGEEWRGTGVVLVVDDDAFICEVATQILKSFGFTTLVAKDGAEGVRLFREHADELVAVLLDLTMPAMDGFEAHAEMHGINPVVPVILMSGFSRKLDHLPPEAIHPAGVLAKPFGMKQLRARLIAVLTPA